MLDSGGVVGLGKHGKDHAAIGSRSTSSIEQPMVGVKKTSLAAVFCLKCGVEKVLCGSGMALFQPGSTGSAVQMVTCMQYLP